MLSKYFFVCNFTTKNGVNGTSNFILELPEIKDIQDIRSVEKYLCDKNPVPLELVLVINFIKLPI